MTEKLHSDPPFRAEHLGSLLRPNELLDKRHEVEEGKLRDNDLKPYEDKAVDDIVKLQLDLGFRAVSDGEYRRHMFWGSFFPGLQGFETIYRPPLDMFRTYMPDIAAFTEEDKGPVDSLICTGKIKHKGSTYIEQWEYLKSKVPKDQVKHCKLTLAAPNWYHMRYRDGQAYKKDVYANDKEYFDDIAKAYHAELQELYDHGLRNVQFDDPNLAYFCSEKMLEGWKADELNTKTPEQLLDEYIELYNDCISARPSDMHVGVHICRGNFVNSRHFSEGGYDRVAKKLFNNMAVNTFYLEYDTPRAGGFEPLRELPKHKNVILGVVTSKFAKLEDFDELKKRVYQAADFVAEGTGQTRELALNQLGVSPQCGFASHAGGNAIDRDGMVGKLKLVRKLADEIWPGQA